MFPKFSENLKMEQRDDVTVLFVRNDLSYKTADDLKAATPHIRSDKILIDLDGTKLTTSRGMAALISIVVKADEKSQEVCICNVSEYFMHIFDAMDLMNHVNNLKIVDTFDDGVTYFKELKPAS